MNFKIAILLFLALLLLTGQYVIAHETLQHLDPDLLSGWITWFHLTVQWLHLTGFALYCGLTICMLLLGAKPSLDQLLYPAWILLLLMLATGTYNMEYSAGISERPSLLMLPSLEEIPYGVTYTTILAVKLALYLSTVLITLGVTLLRLWSKVEERRLKRVFLVCQSVLIVMIALMTATVLFYHEVADLWPTPVHSSGGVVGAEAPQAQIASDESTGSPNDFRLLATGNTWLDISARFFHLLGFGLWLGASGVAVLFTPVAPGRFLSVLWAGLLVQILSGMANMDRWTPFDVPPYFWNLDHLSHIRLGRSYTTFMAAKQILVFCVVVLTTTRTFRYIRLRSNNNRVEQGVRSLAGAGLVLGLVIAYIMIIVLLLHEGVDHAL